MKEPQHGWYSRLVNAPLHSPPPPPPPPPPRDLLDRSADAHTLPIPTPPSQAHSSEASASFGPPPTSLLVAAVPLPRLIAAAALLGEACCARIEGVAEVGIPPNRSPWRRCVCIGSRSRSHDGDSDGDGRRWPVGDLL